MQTKITGRPVEEGHELIRNFVEQSTGILVSGDYLHLCDADGNSLGLIFSPDLAEEFRTLSDSSRLN